MGFGFVGGDCPDQAYLLPPDVRDWLPARHLAWALLEETGRMDLSAFTCWYRADGQGRPAYHPAMMVALLGYCYCKGIRSSRAIEAATFDDVGARVICQIGRASCRERGKISVGGGAVKTRGKNSSVR